MNFLHEVIGVEFGHGAEGVLERVEVEFRFLRNYFFYTEFDGVENGHRVGSAIGTTDFLTVGFNPWPRKR